MNLKAIHPYDISFGYYSVQLDFGLYHFKKFGWHPVTYITIHWLNYDYPVDTGRKLNVYKTFRKRPGRLLNVLCTFNLRPVSTD